MRQTLTAGIDGSAESLDAAQWAAREALLRDLPLTLLHAGYAPAFRTRPPEAGATAEREDHALDTAVRKLLAGHPTLKLVPLRVPEAPVEALLAAAESSQMLVLGSHGFSGFAGFVVGSVALDVTARARCPVVLVRAGERPEDEHLLTLLGAPSARTPYRPVVLGLDLAQSGDELLAYAFAAAAARSAPLRVLHVWRLPLLYAHGRVHEPLSTPDVQAVQAELERALTDALDGWRDKYPGIEVTEHLVDGRAAHHLLLASTGASLVVVGRRDSAGPRLGPVTHSVIHHVTCPVAVVPHA
ncbi:universal stress protein [Streptomyces sannanensis]|uniref:Universal stress protein n=1 Tax=Streptomyces sannanensis TaxID=285536 RepID=A0ABP6SKY4_9ACTN